MRFMLDWTLFPQSVPLCLRADLSLLNWKWVTFHVALASRPGKLNSEKEREDVAAGSLAGTRGRLCAHVGEGGREGGSGEIHVE